MESFQSIYEEIKAFSHDLSARVEGLIREGNVRRVIIKDEHGNTFIEIPVTVAAVGAVFAPIVAAVGAIAAMAARFTIVVEKRPDSTASGSSGPAEPGSGTSTPETVV